MDEQTYAHGEPHGGRAGLDPWVLTTKAATSCPPLILADLWRQLARGASRRAPHALLMVVHEVVGAQHAPARARLRLAAVSVARGLRVAGARTPRIARAERQ